MVSSAQALSVANKPLYLTKVSYNEPKAEILAEFSNKGERVVKRYKFYPLALFSSSISSEKLIELILSLGFKGFNISEKNNLLYLHASSFAELKKISNALSLHLNKKPLVLEPERAFLLERNWSYFDSFEQQGSLMVNTSHNLQGSPSKDLSFFLIKEISFPQALKLSEQDSLFLVEQAAWSEVLSLPMEKIPLTKEERVELFLENVFFKHGEMLSFDSGEKFFSEKDYSPFSYDATSEIDFSLVWAELFSNTFFNIGPETKNCSCCSPVVLDARNLLPSSMIKIQFKEDNLFFESSSCSFAMNFHNSMPFKDQRVSKKKEFFLNSFPVGPFFKDDFALVPLMDAKRLVEGKKAVLVSSKQVLRNEDSSLADNNNSFPVSVHELNWFCLNKESFFSKEVRLANNKLFAFRRDNDFFEKDFVSQKSFGYFYSKAMYSVLSQVLSELPSQLTNSNSKFFSTSLAKNIVSVQEATISKFKEFSEKNGYRVLHAGKSFASVKGFSSLKLAKDFSEQTKLPQPEIVSFKSVQKKTYRAFA